MSLEELLYTSNQEARLEERRKIEEVLREEGINEKTISEILEKLAQKGIFVKATCK